MVPESSDATMPPPPDPGFAVKFLERLHRIPADQLEAFVSQFIRERDFLRAVLDAAPEGIIVADEALGVDYVNPAARALLGLPTDAELAGAPLERVVRRGGTLADVVERFRMEREPITQADCGTTATGRAIVASASPIRGAGLAGIAGHSVWLVSDRTMAQKRSDEKDEARRLEALATLTSGIAHEIKNPLNSMNIHAQLIEKAAARIATTFGESAELERMKRSAAVLREEIARLAGVVDQFNKAVRPQRPEFRRASLNDVLVSVAELMGPECRQGGVQLEVQLDPTLPLLPVDPAQMREAVLNLTRNALEAIAPPDSGRARDDGRIVLRSAQMSDHALIEVVDNGAGIAPEDHARIFEPYHTTKFNGTGLGLMQVYRTVKAHKGAIGLTSTPGRGTTFHIALPLDERPVRLLAAPPIEPSGERAGR